MDVDSEGERKERLTKGKAAKKVKKVEFRQAVKAARATAVEGSADEFDPGQMPTQKRKPEGSSTE
jgi:hypothetical protein